MTPDERAEPQGPPDSPGKAESGRRPEVDRVFVHPEQRVQDFDFGERTARVFDDMLQRSVPHYDVIQRMVVDLAIDFAQDDTSIYDLGCSTGTTLAALGPPLAGRGIRLVGLDYSQEMLDRAEVKLREDGLGDSVVLRHADLNDTVTIEGASVVLMVLTLQFVRPLLRERLLRNICRGMSDGGCLLLVEKVLGANSTLNRLFIEHYYDLKRSRGYSDLEISQKREALENVLVPYRLDENLELLRETGFKTCEVFFKWYNFCGIIAVKG